MAVSPLTEFPCRIVAGDTIRVTIKDSRYPSDDWTLKVLLQSFTESKSFDTEERDDDGFDLELDTEETAALTPGRYKVAYVFTETATDERVTTHCCRSVDVYADPTVALPKSQNRLTLEAMQAAYLKLMSGSHITVNFNGQSFTKRNPKDLEDAIEKQKAIVAAEDAQRLGTCGSGGYIFHPL